MELLQPAVGLIFWQLVIFGTLFFLLKKFAWKPILKGLSDRENEISSALKMAEETRAEMAKLKSENDRIIVEAKLERDQIIKEAKESSDKLISMAKDSATKEGSRIIEDARESIELEKNKMLTQARKDVAALSIEIAEKVIRKELGDKSAQQQLVTDLIGDAKLN